MWVFRAAVKIALGLIVYKSIWNTSYNLGSPLQVTTQSEEAEARTPCTQTSVYLTMDY